MLGLKVRKKNAEKVKRYLAKHKLMVINYRVFSTGEFIYFPITSAKTIKQEILKGFGAQIGRHDFEKGEDKNNYKQALKERLGNSYEKTSRGYDTIGDIAVIDIVESKIAAKKTAQVIMALNKNIKTVIAKAGPVQGPFRTRKYEHIAGEKRFDAFYRENGATFHFDLRKTFFSSRLAFERKRIADISKDGENVVVMFAGVGPFAIEIARKNSRSKIIAMELNPSAVEYMKENIGLNRTPNVAPELGDVKKLALKHANFADRIVMPHPTDSYSFLDAAIKCARKGCMVHFYTFAKRDGSFKEHAKKLKSFFSRKKVPFKVAFQRVAREYSKDEVEMVIDFVLK